MPSREKRPEDRLLTLKAQRGQIQARLEEWETTHAQLHSRPSTLADRQRSSQYRELSRLLSDLDGYIQSLEGGLGGLPTHQAEGSSVEEVERRAERGRVKARMRRWDREFERKYNRKPNDADRNGSDEFARLREKLRGTEQHPGVSAEATHASGGGPSAAAAGGADEAGAARPTDGGNGGGSSGSGSGGDAGRSGGADRGGWWLGNDYHELIRSMVTSHTAVNGFEGLSAAEVHAAAESFAAWDLNRDGVLDHDEFAKVVRSLSSGLSRPTQLDDEVVQRLFALADHNGDGNVDFNEFLSIHKRMLPEGESG